MNIENLDLLREALPYIQRFQGKTFVVKFSGKVTEDKENLGSLAEELALLHQVGIRVCVIHGGGKQLTEMAKKLGMVQTIIEGRRVTDDDTLELAKMIFRGKINTEILSQFRRRGIHAVGLSGIDGGVIKAVKRPPKDIVNRETGETETIDFGHVGDIVEVDSALVKLLLDAGYLPVISSLAADDSGKVYNINADTIAAEIAAELGAEKLILLSDVNGIYLDPTDETTKLSQVTAKEARDLITSGRATGGMIPKLENLILLLDRGVHSAHVISGTKRNAVLAEGFTDEGTGTMVVAGEEPILITPRGLAYHHRRVSNNWGHRAKVSKPLSKPIGVIPCPEYRIPVSSLSNRQCFPDVPSLNSHTVRAVKSAFIIT